MASFEIRFSICINIIPYLSGSARLILSQCHRDFRDSCESFVQIVREMTMIKDMEYTLVKFVAKKCRRDLCELLTRYYSAHYDYFTRWSIILLAAARQGNHEICRLAYNGGAGDKLSLISYAARHGHFDFCFLKDFHTSDETQVLVWTMILLGATYTNNRE